MWRETKKLSWNLTKSSHINFLTFFNLKDFNFRHAQREENLLLNLKFLSLPSHSFSLFVPHLFL